jgi:hypothetical protein
MDKFNNFYDEDIPVCRFGPGGDFFSDWPARVKKDYSQPIGSILAAISKIIDAAITSQLLQDPILEKINLAVNGGEFSANMEDKFDVNKSDESDAQTIAGLEADRKLSQEPMLFDNASGNGKPLGHKQNNGVRAHRRPKRKRITFSASRQGSLFEPHPESSKVA